METEIEIGPVVAEALEHVSLSIQEHVLVAGKAPTLDEAKRFVSEGSG